MCSEITPGVEVCRRRRIASAFGLLALLLLALGLKAAAQGTITTLRTGVSGDPIVTSSLSFVVPSGSRAAFQVNFGFSTAETAGPGQLFDSFTISLVDSVTSTGAVYVTVDANGASWAPPTPGNIPIDAATILRAPVAFPSLQPVLPWQTAFSMTAPIPAEFAGHTVNLYFDLFDNQNALASLGWHDAVVVVPEPAPLALLLAAGIVLLGFARTKARGRRLPGGCAKAAVFALLALLGLAGMGLRADAEQRTFTLSGASLTLDAVDADIGVIYSAMRYNRAADIWNVEVTLTNQSQRTVSGPFVYALPSFTNTSGLPAADGGNGISAYLDLSPQISGGALVPGAVSGPRTLSLGRTSGTPSISARIFAGGKPALSVVLARALDDAGHPLGSVQVAESGAVSGSYTTDQHFGFVTLGQGGGTYVWRFSRTNYLPVWRQATLGTNEVNALAYPRLTPRSTNVVSLSSLGGGQVSDAEPTIRISFPAGAFSDTAHAILTPLSGQALPALLPGGWSLLRAFWLELDREPALPGTALILPPAPVGANERALLARWESNALQWQVTAVQPGNGSNVLNAPIAQSGAYGLVIGDSGMPLPNVGQALPAIAAVQVNPANLSAAGSVNPATSAASTVPAMVTAAATLAVTNRAGVLPSGLLLRADVTETYRMLDGSRRVTPPYDSFIIAYQRPGDADPSTVHAAFPLRPLLLLGADELEEAHVTMQVIDPSSVSPTVIGTNGGQLAGADVRLVVGAGELTRPQAAILRILSPALFDGMAGPGNSVMRAFELSMGELEAGHRLLPQFGPQTNNSSFVLARVIAEAGVYGFEPVERFASDANGAVRSVEPLVGERLPGVSAPGQYVLLRVAAPQGIVSGTARNAAGIGTAGLVVKLAPWLTLSGRGGSYTLLSPTGAVAVAVSDPAGTDTGSATGTMDATLGAVHLDAAIAAVAPRVVSVSPAAGSTGVDVLAPVTVTFSEPVNPGSLLGTGMQLLDASDAPVPVTLALNLRNTAATLLPLNPLAPNTAHTVRLSTNITDLSGTRLEGPNQFSFTTKALVVRPAAAQVTSYEPTNGVAVLLGSAGIADPNSTVILLNESSGRTSTVLANADGSFSNVITAEVNDFLSALVVNANSTRTTIPVSRQIYADGRVGLFTAGGTLEAVSDDAAVRVDVPPGAIAGKTVFRLATISVSNLLAQFGQVAPSNAQVFAGLRLQTDGDALAAAPVITFTVDAAQLRLPAGVNPTNALYVAAVPRQVDGITAYEYRARLSLSAGSATAPAVAGKTRTKTFITPMQFTAGGAAFAGGFEFLSAMIMDPAVYAPATAVGVAGKVQTAKVTAPKAIIPGTEQPLGGAVVTISDLEAVKSQPLRFNPGELFTVSNPNGSFEMLAPQLVAGSEGFAAVASHPRFPRQFAGSPALRVAAGTSIIRTVITFEEQLNPPDLFPPAITASHSPFRPPPGTNVTLVVSGSDDGVPVPVTVEGPPYLVEGGNATSADVTVTGAAGGPYIVNCTKPAKVTLILAATDGVNTRRVPYAIQFGGTQPVDPNPVFLPNPNDKIGPYVVATRPAAAPDGAPTAGTSGVMPGQPIVIRFNEPIDAGVTLAPSNFLSLLPNNAGAPSARLEENQRDLVIFYPYLKPGTEYELTLQGVKDISGNAFDQDPGTNVQSSFSFKFIVATQKVVSASVLVENGGGAVIRGIYAYVLDRAGPEDGALVVLDLSNPSAPAIAARLDLPSYPRDLVLLPRYSFQRGPHDPPETSDVLAIVGGRVTGDTMSQYLCLVRITNGLAPELIASGIVSADPTAAITRIAWNAPNLAFIENGAIYPSIHLAELQRFVYGRNVTPADYSTLPALVDDEGLDANGDGDFVDSGDRLPLPALQGIGYPGRVDTFTLDRYQRHVDTQVLTGTSRFVNDIAVAPGGDLVGAVITGGIDTVARSGATNRITVNPSYRSFLRGDLDGDRMAVQFPGYNPKRVLIATGIDWPGYTAPPLLAFVAMVKADLSDSKIVVVDITVDSLTGYPATNILNEIAFPLATFGLVQGLARTDDGRFIVSTETNFVVLEPSLLTNSVAAGAVHPAIVGTVPGASAGPTTFAFNAAGLGVSTLGHRTQVTQLGPRIRLVNGAISGPYQVVDSGNQLPANITLRDEINSFYPPLQLNLASNGPPSNLTPNPDPLVHNYVMVDAPGSAGATIRLRVESLDAAGQPLDRDSATSAPPAVVEGMRAFRVSNDPSQPEYNLYLSSPFALIAEEMSGAAFRALTNSPFYRPVLYAGNSLRAELSPAMLSSPVLGDFASSIEPLPPALPPPDPARTPFRFGAPSFPPPATFPFIPLPGMPAPPPVTPSFLRPGSFGLTATRLPPAFLDPTNAYPRTNLLTIRTTVDRINGQVCPGALRFTFTLTHEALVTLQVADHPGGLFQPYRDGVEFESSTNIPQFVNIPFSAGTHAVLIDSIGLGLPGDHPYLLTATNLPYAGGFAITNIGVIEHHVEIDETFPIAHTIVQGVDIVDGHLALSRQDIVVPGRKLSLDFTRSYSNSGDGNDGPLGAGWTHSYHCRLVRRGCNVWSVIGGEGSGNSFTDTYDPAVQANLAARYAPFLTDRTNVNEVKRTFLRPQVGYHSVLVDYPDAGEADFFSKSGVRYHFKREPYLNLDDAFTLREIREPHGNRIVLTYSPDGDNDPTTLDLVAEVDPLGYAKRGLIFEYGIDPLFAKKRISRLIGTNFITHSTLIGLQVSYEYDRWGNLTNVVRAGVVPGTSDRRQESYTYTPGDYVTGHNMLSYTDPNGSVTIYTYDSLSGPAPGSYYFSGGAAPAIIPGVPPNEIIRSVRRVAANPADDAVTSFTYDFAGRTRFVSDPRGMPDTKYDLNIYGATVKITAPLGQVTEMQWATDAASTSVLDASGAAIRDALMIYRKDAEGQEHLYEYLDGRGNLTRETVRFSATKEPVTGDNGTGSVPSISTSYSYDPAFNQQTSVTDAAGHTTGYTIDPLKGHLDRVTDAENNVTRHYYFANGDLKETEDARGFFTRYRNYDDYGNAHLVTDGNNNATTQDFDERSRLERSYGAFGRDVVSRYDGLDRKIHEEKRDGLSRGSGPAQVTDWLYLPNGELSMERNGLGVETHHFYDALNRQYRTEQRNVRLSTGATVTYVTTRAYDRDGNVTDETDARGIMRHHGYDALNRRTGTTLVSGPAASPVALVVFGATYDLVGNMLTETDLHGSTTTYKHDGLYRVVKQILPLTAVSATVRTAYDRMGNKVIQSDANGKEMTMTYDRVYRLKTRTDAALNQTTFDYDAAGNRTREENASSGLITEYPSSDIDGLNRPKLMRQTVPLGPPGSPTEIYETKFVYTDAANTVEVENPRHVVTKTVKDGLGRVAQAVVDPGGLELTTTFKYDANGNQTEVYDPQGNNRDLLHEYDGLNRKFRTTYLAGTGDTQPTVKEEWLFDGNGNVTGYTDKRGVRFANTYDNLNRPLEKHLIESITFGGNDLTVTAYVYNDAANQVTVTDANGHPTLTHNDELGRPLTVKDALNQVLTNAYDGVNKTLKIDRKGQRTKYYYDNINRLTRTEEYDAANVLRTTTRTQYVDNQNQKIDTDRNDIDTISQLDGLGRLLQLSRARGNLAAEYGASPLLLETRAYDGKNNLIFFRDGNSNVTTNGYDAADRKTVVAEGVGSAVLAVTTTTYDNAGNVLTIKDGRAHGGPFDSSYTYDDRYRRVSAENGENEVTTYEYDENNNVTKVTEPRGAVFTTYYTYDELNKLTAVDETARASAGTPAGRTLFLYDAARNKIGQQDANGNLVTYEYDVLNRLTVTKQHTQPGAIPFPVTRGAAAGGGAPLTWQFGYDGNNNQNYQHDPRGQQVDSAFDWLDRVVTRAYSNHAEKNAGIPLRFQALTLTNMYDGNGNLLGAFEGKQGVAGPEYEKTIMTYDGLNRVRTRTRFDSDMVAGSAIAFTYDVQGNRKTVTDPDGVRTDYAYDARNRLQTVILEANGVPRTITYDWWPDSLLRRVAYPNGAVCDRSAPLAYDKADRVRSILNWTNAPGGVISRYDYTYDGNGNRATQTEFQLAMGPAETTQYGYDNLNRLATVTYGAAGSVTYTYEANGNRLTETGVDPVTGLAVNRAYHYNASGPNTFSGVNALRQIEDLAAPAQSVSYEYDPNLNQTARIVGGTRRDFRFGIRDQIIETTSGPATTLYDYNHDRLRAKKIDGAAGETRYLYDQSSVLVEYGGGAAAHATRSKYDYGYSLLALTSVSATRDRDYYLSDGLRSTANLTADNGSLHHSYRYDAWGRVRAQAGSSSNPRQYTGHYKDAETGLHYFGARYYDEQSGRFTSQDPYLGEANTPPSLHRYLYAYANPLRFIDLSGYQAQEQNKEETKKSAEKDKPPVSAGPPVVYQDENKVPRDVAYYPVTSADGRRLFVVDPDAKKADGTPYYGENRELAITTGELLAKAAGAGQMGSSRSKSDSLLTTVKEGLGLYDKGGVVAEKSESDASQKAANGAQLSVEAEGAYETPLGIKVGGKSGGELKVEAKIFTLEFVPIIDPKSGEVTGFQPVKGAVEYGFAKGEIGYQPGDALELNVELGHKFDIPGVEGIGVAPKAAASLKIKPQGMSDEHPNGVIGTFSASFGIEASFEMGGVEAKVQPKVSTGDITFGWKYNPFDPMANRAARDMMRKGVEGK